jgi:hypothetical protein
MTTAPTSQTMLYMTLSLSSTVSSTATRRVDRDKLAKRAVVSGALSQQGRSAVRRSPAVRERLARKIVGARKLSCYVLTCGRVSLYGSGQRPSLDGVPMLVFHPMGESGGHRASLDIKRRCRTKAAAVGTLTEMGIGRGSKSERTSDSNASRLASRITWCKIGAITREYG